MGTVVSMCGFGPASDHSDAHLEFLREDKTVTASDRSRAHSGGTDTSVASILSSVDTLIPDAFQPVDIQVLSRGRRRSGVQLSGQTTPSKSVPQPSLHGSASAAPSLQRHGFHHESIAYASVFANVTEVER